MHRNTLVQKKLEFLSSAGQFWGGNFLLASTVNELSWSSFVMDSQIVESLSRLEYFIITRSLIVGKKVCNLLTVTRSDFCPRGRRSEFGTFFHPLRLFGFKRSTCHWERHVRNSGNRRLFHQNLFMQARDMTNCGENVSMTFKIGIWRQGISNLAPKSWRHRNLLMAWHLQERWQLPGDQGNGWVWILTKVVQNPRN